MRELKYRVFVPNKNLITQLLGWGLLGRIEYKHNDTFVIDTNGRCIIMQYTGLKDKNGSEIYEGDILKWIPINKIVSVCFDEDCPGYYVNLGVNKERLFKRRMKWFEIVGNIYQNKELIK